MSGVYSNAISKAALTEYVSIFPLPILTYHAEGGIIFLVFLGKRRDTSIQAAGPLTTTQRQGCKTKKIFNQSNIIFNVQDLLTALKRKAEEDRKKGIKVDDGSEKQWVIFLQVGTASKVV